MEIQNRIDNLNPVPEKYRSIADESVAVVIMIGFAVFYRLLSRSTIPVFDISFSTENGYETFGYVQYFATGEWSEVTELATYPDGGVLTRGLFYEAFIGAHGLLFSLDPATLAGLTKIYNVLFFCAGLVLFYLFARKLVSKTAAQFALFLTVLLPGTILAETVISAGGNIGFQLFMFGGFVYVFSTLLSYTQENYTILIEEYTKEYYGLLFGTILFAVGAISVNISTGYIMLGILAITGPFIFYQWSEDYNGLSELQKTFSYLTAGITVLSALLFSLEIPVQLYSYGALILGLAAVTVGYLLVQRFHSISPTWRNTFPIVNVGIQLSAIALLQDELPTIFPQSQAEQLFAPVTTLLALDIQSLYLSEFGIVVFVGLIGLLGYGISVYNRSHSWTIASDSVFLSVGILVVLGHIIQVTTISLFSLIIVLFTAYTYEYVAKQVELTTVLENPTESQGYQIIVVVALVVLLIPTLMFPLSGTAVAQAQQVSDIGAEETDIGTFIQEVDSDSAVVTWGTSGKIIGATSGAPTTGQSLESAEFASTVYLENNESELPDDVRFVVAGGSELTAFGSLGTINEIHPELEQEDLVTPVLNQQSGDLAFLHHTQRYYESSVIRNHFYHGSSYADTRFTATYTEREDVALTHDFEEIAAEDHIVKHESNQAAQEYADSEDIGVQEIRSVGGIGIHSPEQIRGTGQMRYVYSSENPITQSPEYANHAQHYLQFSGDEQLDVRDFYLESANTKVFENVEGAEITIENISPNSQVQVLLTLENEQTGEQFRYIRTAVATEDTLTITVPYATENIPEPYSVGPANHPEYEVIVDQQAITGSNEEDIEVEQVQTHASVNVTNDMVLTDENPDPVTPTEITEDELREILERQGIAQPEPEVDVEDPESETDTSDDNSDE